LVACIASSTRAFFLSFISVSVATPSLMIATPPTSFPWHGRDKKIDPTRSMTSWRSAWRSLRRAAGLPDVRFHDGRHTALTRLAEAGQPDWVIQAQIGHVSPQMMKTYSHIRRMALDEAAAVLEPNFEFKKPAPRDGADNSGASDETPTSQVTSQSDDLPSDIAEILKEVGSSGWTRTNNPPVNSSESGPQSGSTDSDEDPTIV
jgi:hypothetical protein